MVPHGIGRGWHVTTAAFASDASAGAAPVATARVVSVPCPGDGDAPALLGLVCASEGPPADVAFATHLATEAVLRHLAAHPVASLEGLAAALQAAHRAVAAVARRRSGVRACTTACTALLLHRGMAWCAQVGTVRVYLQRASTLYCMTQDQALAMSRVARGELSIADARWHPEWFTPACVLGRDVAATVSSWPTAFALHDGDRWLLCTRGVQAAISERALSRLLARDPPQVVCEELLAAARAGGRREPLAAAVLAVAG